MWDMQEASGRYLITGLLMWKPRSKQTNKQVAENHSYITHPLPKYFTSEWSFSKIEVPGGTRCICAFGANNNTVLAVCDDSSYHKFVYDERKEDFTRDNYHMFVESDSK